MLYMVIVPIIPDYLRYIGAWETHKVDSEGHEIVPSQGVEGVEERCFQFFIKI